MSEQLRVFLQRQRLAYQAHDAETFYLVTSMIFAQAMAEGWPFGKIFSQTGEAYV